MRRAILDKRFQTAFKRAKLFQLAAHFGEMRLCKIARCNAVALQRSRERRQFAALLYGESQVPAAADKGEPPQIRFAIDTVPPFPSVASGSSPISS